MGLIDINIELLNTIIEARVNEHTQPLLERLERAELHAQKQVLTIEEAAQYMGLRVSTVRYLMRENLLPYYKTDKRVYLKTVEIDQYLTKNRVKSSQEIADSAVKLLRNRQNVR